MASVVFPAPPFWLMIAMTGMATTLHVDMATWQVVDMLHSAYSRPGEGITVGNRLLLLGSM